MDDQLSTRSESPVDRFLVVLAFRYGMLSLRWVSGRSPGKSVRRWRATTPAPFIVLAAFPLSVAGRVEFAAVTGVTALPALVHISDHQFWVERAPLDPGWRSAADAQTAHIGGEWVPVAGGLRQPWEPNDLPANDSGLVIESIYRANRDSYGIYAELKKIVDG